VCFLFTFFIDFSFSFGKVAFAAVLTFLIHKKIFSSPNCQIYSIETGRCPTVKVAAHLMRRLCYENKDRLLAGVIVGGWDPVDGGSVYNIPLGGTCIKMPFAIGGSGSTYIYGLVDSEFKEGMTKDEALTLVKKAISHAMARDGSSGGIIRTVTVTEESNDREFVPGNQLPYGPAGW